MALKRLYTDASVNDQTGAWGALWEGPDGEVTVGGAFSEQMVCTATAEIFAIWSGLYMMHGMGDAEVGDVISVYSDSQAALRYIRCYEFSPPRGKAARESRKRCTDAARMVRDLVAQMGIRVVFKQVRGHVRLDKNPTVHELANRRVDLVARHMARTERKRRQGGG